MSGALDVLPDVVLLKVLARLPPEARWQTVSRKWALLAQSDTYMCMMEKTHARCAQTCVPTFADVRLGCIQTDM